MNANGQDLSGVNFEVEALVAKNRASSQSFLKVRGEAICFNNKSDFFI